MTDTTNTIPTEPQSFAAACKHFFGFLPGQGLGAFSTELKALTAEDRAEIRAGMEKLGYKFKD